MSEPPTVDANTAHTAAMNRWFAQSFDNHMAQHIDDINKTFHQVELGFDDRDTELGKIERTILELMKIIKFMSIGDAYTRGCVDTLLRSFRTEQGIEREQLAVVFTDERTRTTETSKRSIERRSLSDVVGSIAEVEDNADTNKNDVRIKDEVDENEV